MSAHSSLTVTLGDERNQRILIIDDNTSIHEDVRKILGAPANEDTALDKEAAELFDVQPEQFASSQFEIDSAFQGQEGLAMVEKARDEGRPYAMAIVDVRMPPGWDGIETIRRIWKTYPELQVVVCTAYSDYSWQEMIRKVGKTDSLVVLKKPFDNIEVLQLAHALTQKWTLSDRLHGHLESLDKIVASRTQELQAANTRLRQEMDEREQAERELGLSEERFAKAFQASPIPMAIQSLGTERFIDINDAFLAMIGFRRIEVVSRTPVELELCPEDRMQQQLFMRLRASRSLRNFEFQVRTRGFGVRDCVIAAEAFELGAEAVVLLAIQDVSEQRRLEKELRHAQKLEAVGQFAAGVAHDFNNMLTVIQGHASIQLAAKNLEKGVSESLAQVSLAAERAAALTRQLLTFSRKQVVQPRTLDLNEIVRNLHDMLRRLIGADIDLRCELADRLPAIHADQSNVEQVIVNLVVNARDAMPNGGRLVIFTRDVDIDLTHVEQHPQARLGNHVCLGVTDTGCGMTPETLSHVFEPFFTTKEVGKGTGLGLATVYGVVTQQEGWIEVTSSIGQGTTFEIFLTVSADPAQSARPGETNDLCEGDETILVVEDEPAVREIMTHILREKGYRVLEAADGSEAITLWSEHASAVDLLVTDIVMPNGLKGNVLAERFRAEKEELKVIFSSGYSSDFGTDDTPLGEGCEFLQKPYKPEVLEKAVRRALDRTRGDKNPVSSPFDKAA
jgi:two-component system cell cycle sensor histidine kinase/response regulator CckA